jgi:predicted short-subunit dehydrogenase-like oxidoreductase (DUF2520 family)
MKMITTDEVTILGTGKVAYHLASALNDAGIGIRQIYGRDKQKASALAVKCSARAIARLEDLDTEADLFILCIADQSIQELITKINTGRKLIVHTSGSVPMNVFKPHFQNFGVFYPLQTFSKERNINFREIPVCIEGSNSHNEALLTFLALKLSDKVQVVDSDTRLVLHTAAVFASNFTNFAYAIAEDLLKTVNLDFDLIRPLIKETADRVQTRKPGEVQTGPAIRNDQVTIDKHLYLLRNHEDYRLMYEKLTEMIKRKFNS